MPTKKTAETKTTARKTTAKSSTRGATATATKSRAAKTAASSTNGATATATTTRRRGGSIDLVIVESPAKARTIQGILGPGYEVTASVGHVRDFPKSTLGVDVDNDF